MIFSKRLWIIEKTKNATFSQLHCRAASAFSLNSSSAEVINSPSLTELRSSDVQLSIVPGTWGLDGELQRAWLRDTGHRTWGFWAEITRGETKTWFWIIWWIVSFTPKLSPRDDLARKGPQTIGTDHKDGVYSHMSHTNPVRLPLSCEYTWES